MTTIKSYTDLEQSKKLAEILPLESADMYYEEVCNLPKVIVGNYILHNQCMEDKDYKKLSNPVLSPAWSLAALLGVLPKRIELEGVAYELSIYLNGLYYWNVNNGNLLLEVKGKDNLVDACVAMIEKLNELNLI